MYLGVDIGGTKTLLACFNKSGEVTDTTKFPTAKNYDAFIENLSERITTLNLHDYQAGCVAIPGKVDRKHGRGLVFGNLLWKNVPIQADVERIINAPVIVENDSKLAGLSEALLIINEFKKVLYVTVGTGISAAIIISGKIDPNFADSESGHMLLEHNGKLQIWESFASGKAIVKQFGKKARDITDPTAWKIIAHNISIGLIDLMAVIQPEIIIFGGGVGQYYNKFAPFLNQELKKYEMPLVPIPPIKVAKHPEEAVIYGCYELIKSTYGSTAR